MERWRPARRGVPPLGDLVVAFQVPITFQFGGSLLDIADGRQRRPRPPRRLCLGRTGSNDVDRDAPATWRKLIDMRVDGTMTLPALSRTSACCGATPGPSSRLRWATWLHERARPPRHGSPALQG